MTPHIRSPRQGGSESASNGGEPDVERHPWAHPHPPGPYAGAPRRPGANSIEYAGIVILVAGIILAIRALGLDAMISGAVANAVSAYGVADRAPVVR